MICSGDKTCTGSPRQVHDLRPKLATFGQAWALQVPRLLLLAGLEVLSPRQA